MCVAGQGYAGREFCGSMIRACDLLVHGADWKCVGATGWEVVGTASLKCVCGAGWSIVQTANWNFAGGGGGWNSAQTTE